MNDTLFKIIAITLLIVFIGIVYQAYVVVPQNKIDAQIEQAEADRRAEILREMARENKYDMCMQRAYNVYSQNWDSKCNVVGKEADCTLFQYEYAEIEARYEKDQADCLAIYKAN